MKVTLPRTSLLSLTEVNFAVRPPPLHLPVAFSFCSIVHLAEHVITYGTMEYTYFWTWLTNKRCPRFALLLSVIVTTYSCCFHIMLPIDASNSTFQNFRSGRICQCLSLHWMFLTIMVKFIIKWSHNTNYWMIISGGMQYILQNGVPKKSMTFRKIWSIEDTCIAWVRLPYSATDNMTAQLTSLLYVPIFLPLNIDFYVCLLW